jgi:hypothetical protein
MITLAAVVSCAAVSWLRTSLGALGPVLPWLGLAWTLLFARYSRRATFALVAVALGAIDGLTAPAAWTAWPIAYLLAGTLAFSTRRVLPVDRAFGEIVLGAIAAALVRVVALPFPPLDLPGGTDPMLPGAIGALLTGVATAGLVSLSKRWVGLRMRLTSVT